MPNSRRPRVSAGLGRLARAKLPQLKGRRVGLQHGFTGSLYSGTRSPTPEMLKQIGIRVHTFGGRIVTCTTVS
ncbi:MAG: hypothetical protein HY049_05100 [Acidobacteria bacterium]|nr:hypothetical protein [Acidobacteriota bacterium]